MDRIFVPAKAREIVPRMLTYGHVFDGETAVDEVLAVFMPAPATYTAEDVVEINCHGGSIPLYRTLKLAMKYGARPAEPGEFTKRAFLNGRIDLSQAEAVMDVVGAKTEEALEIAVSRLRGKFSEEIGSLRKALTDVLVKIDVNIDYPDEDVEEAVASEIREELVKINDSIGELIASANTGRIMKEGLKTAIVGRPNVGKSSLLNGLLRESRAIVTAIPGTTRDTIEEFANIGGIPVRLTDTAGIRETEDVVEKIGIERAREAAEDADLVLFLIDSSEPLTGGDLSILKSLDPANTVILFNKSDLEAALTPEEMDAFGKGFRCVRTAFTSKDSIRAVEDIIRNFCVFGTTAETPENVENAGVSGGMPIRSGRIVTDARHLAMLQNASRAIDESIMSLDRGEPFELVEIDLREASESLGFITGDSVQDDILKEIFGRFCLGK